MNNFWEMRAIDIIQLGGPLMWLLLLCSVFALGIFLEKLVYFNMIRTNVVDLKKKYL